MTEEKPKRGAMGYYQSASMVLLLIMVGFSISGLWGLVRIIIPDLTMSGYDWRRVSTLDRYLEAEYKGGKRPLLPAGSIRSQVRHGQSRRRFDPRAGGRKMEKSPSRRPLRGTSRRLQANSLLVRRRGGLLPVVLVSSQSGQKSAPANGAAGWSVAELFAGW